MKDIVTLSSRSFKVFLISIVLLAGLFACQQKKPNVPQPRWWEPYDETTDLAATQVLENGRMHLRLINSKVSDKNDIWKPFQRELTTFSKERYEAVRPLILEKDIPNLQKSIKEGKFSYEELTLFYLYRIRAYESDNGLSLNAIITLNPKVLKQAKALDTLPKEDIDEYSVYGMPLLLKDNINTTDMPTTAGAIALQDNRTGDAFITERLLENKALILGKANLSEWAYFLCSGCPVGYSAVGGQTMNPYGRLRFETGGSSSGSGVAVAANFCVAAIGTETSGSILSPSAQNSVVGLKPTIGLLSRSGIVPISSTLDTPGPMTKSVMDNGILLNALLGKDAADAASVSVEKDYVAPLLTATLKGKRLGAIKSLMEDSLYRQSIEVLRTAGAEVVEVETEQTPLPGFLSILNVDMKNDLPLYLQHYAARAVDIKGISDAIIFNNKDSLVRIPYGQQLFDGILTDTTSVQGLEKIKQSLKITARAYFDQHLNKHELDAMLSINNYHAGYAAVALYPALTVPMGYTTEQEPKGLTFITKPFQEEKLLNLGFVYETLSKARKAPKKYIE